MGATVDKPFFTRNGKRIYTITDPPHLLKAVRNSLLTHYILSNGERVDWDHFKKFVTLDRANAARHLIAPKLTDVQLMENQTTYHKMRVNTAAQTLISSVAAGLFTLTRYNALPAAANATAHFFLTFDQPFDSFNGTSLTVEGVKEFRTAITDNSRHLELWSKVVPWLKSLKFIRRPTPSGKKTGKGKGKKQVNVEVEVSDLPFRTSWIWAINATKMLWEDLRAEGYMYLPTRRLNQDALENLFSGIRYNGGNSKAPTPDQFQPALKSSLINMLTRTATSTKKKKKGTENCEEDSDSFLLDLKALFTYQAQRAETSSNPDSSSTFDASPDIDFPGGSNFSMDVDSPSTSFDSSTSTATQNEEQPDNDAQDYVEVDLDAWQSKAAAQIAGAAVRKVLEKIKQCTVCRSALTAVDIAPVHETLTYKDSNLQSLCTYPKEAVCMAADVVMKIGDAKLPHLFPKPGVIKIFRKSCSSVTNLLNDLLWCPAHNELGSQRIFNFLTNTAFYKELKNQNLILRNKDVRTQMLVARDQKKYPIGVVTEEGEDVFENIDDPAEMIYFKEEEQVEVYLERSHGIASFYNNFVFEENLEAVEDLAEESASDSFRSYYCIFKEELTEDDL